MDPFLAGTGETTDLSLLVFGLAVLFGLLFFILWFPGWRRRLIREKNETEYTEAYLENAGLEGKGGTEDAEARQADLETGESYHKSP